MNSITVNAYAKINLTLDILGKRPDGYHEVCMVMQSLQLHDTITLRKTTASGVRFSCNVPGVPTDSSNLAVRAAELFLDTYGLTGGCEVILSKRIPAAAGLGGGSSDAAAVLLGLRELTSRHDIKTTALFDSEEPSTLRMPLAPEADNNVLPPLHTLALKLGADVPFFLMLGTALSEGIGERLTKLAPAPDCHCLLVKPLASASTKQIYSDYDALALATNIPRPDTARMLDAISRHDYAAICDCLGNVLEPATIQRIPDIAAIKHTLRVFGADGVLMSGSGSTVFALYLSEKAAVNAREHIASEYPSAETILTRFHRA